MTLTRQELEQAFPGQRKMVLAFEKQQQQVSDTASATAATVEATELLQDATVLTLSPNATLNNERVLQVRSPLQITDNGPGNGATLGFSFAFTINGGYALTLNLFADTNLDVPTSGALLTSDLSWVLPQDYADDAAAAVAGVAVGGFYHNAGELRVRLS